MVRIRKAESVSDFRKLHELFVKYQADLPKDLRLGNVPDIRDITERYGKHDAAFLATRDGKPIGCAAVAGLDAETAVMLRLFVTPESRGLGAARALVTAAIAFARESGYHRIVLDTSRELLKPAYLLYRSLGFQECEPFGSVSYQSPTFMELRLRTHKALADDRI
ncbi:MAG TPA: GNAT family N-acetyltransferase [Candidatus Cybelea sp.]